MFSYVYFFFSLGFQHLKRGIYFHHFIICIFFWRSQYIYIFIYLIKKGILQCKTVFPISSGHKIVWLIKLCIDNKDYIYSGCIYICHHAWILNVLVYCIHSYVFLMSSWVIGLELMGFFVHFFIFIFIITFFYWVNIPLIIVPQRNLCGVLYVYILAKDRMSLKKKKTFIK